jgi:hypothetical protein
MIYTETISLDEFKNCVRKLFQSNHQYFEANFGNPSDIDKESFDSHMHAIEVAKDHLEVIESFT